MTADEIDVVSAEAKPVSREQEWFIPVTDVSGDGSCWYSGIMTRTQQEAEAQIRNSTFVVKQARIVRVVLPCEAIP